MADSSPSSLFELTFDHESIDHLTETARWGKFLAIVGFIFCGLIVLTAFVMGAIMSSALFSSIPGYPASGAGAFGVIGGTAFAGIYIIFGAIYFFPCLFLYNFSVRLRKALSTNDQIKLNLALKNQKMLYRYVGIVTIITVSLYGLMLLVLGLVMAIAPRAVS